MVKSVKEILSDDFWIMPATPEYKAEGIPYITSKNIKNGSIDFRNVNYISEEDYESISKNRPIENGDILISMIGTLGETAEVTEQDGKFYGQNMFLVRLNSEIINKRYFLNFFQSCAVKRALAVSQNQSTQKYLKANHIEELQIPVPGIEEQGKIADRLDLLSLVITQRKKQLDILDELIKARFVELFGDPVQNPFGWKKKRFDEICENLDSRRKPITSSDRVVGVYPYYGASGIVDYVEAYIFDEDILLVSEDGANLLMRSTPIAFSVSGKVWVNNHAHVVRFKKMCLQKYIEILFSLIDISDSITGSAQPKLNQAKLNAMEFPIPDEDRLEKYLSFLEQVDKSKVVAEKNWNIHNICLVA